MILHQQASCWYFRVVVDDWYLETLNNQHQIISSATRHKGFLIENRIYHNMNWTITIKKWKGREKDSGNNILHG